MKSIFGLLSGTDLERDTKINIWYTLVQLSKIKKKAFNTNHFHFILLNKKTEKNKTMFEATVTLCSNLHIPGFFCTRYNPILERKP